jgi:nucleolar protein 4
VVDKASGKLKGTAFVDYYTRAAADKAAEACAKGRWVLLHRPEAQWAAHIGGRRELGKRAWGTHSCWFHRLCCAAIPLCRLKQGPGVVIAGRVAEVDLALGQQDVRALAAAKAAERGPRDSRRLALAKEGQIAEGSPAWEDMAAGDRAKRKRAAGVCWLEWLG